MSSENRNLAVADKIANTDAKLFAEAVERLAKPSIKQGQLRKGIPSATDEMDISKVFMKSFVRLLCAPTEGRIDHFTLSRFVKSH